MPRINFKKEEYKAKDVSNFIRNEMREKKINQKAISEVIDISQSQLSRKLASANFSLLELIKIFRALDAGPETVGRLLCIKESK